MTARADYMRPMGVLPPLEPRLQAILEEQARSDARIIDEALGHAPALPMHLVTTDDSEAVARITNYITDDPARFAAHFLTLEKLVLHLRERVDGLAFREF